MNFRVTDRHGLEEVDACAVMWGERVADESETCADIVHVSHERSPQQPDGTGSRVEWQGC